MGGTLSYLSYIALKDSKALAIFKNLTGFKDIAFLSLNETPVFPE